MGVISGILNNILKNKNNILNSINEDISELEEEQKKADKAATMFQDCADRTDRMIFEVQTCFNGEAAEAFIAKLTKLSKYCRLRVTEMETLSSNITKRLTELQEQKKKSEEALEKIRNIMDNFSWIWI